MLFLLLSSLRLIPLFILLRLQKSFGKLKLLQKSFYVILTGIFFGVIYVLIPVMYKYIFKYQLFAEYGINFVWIHLACGILIGLLFLSAVKNKIRGEGVVPFLVGVGFIAILFLFDRLQLLLLRDHAIIQN
jgi:hypothetical protein